MVELSTELGPGFESLLDDNGSACPPGPELHPSRSDLYMSHDWRRDDRCAGGRWEKLNLLLRRLCSAIAQLKGGVVKGRTDMCIVLGAMNLFSKWY